MLVLFLCTERHANGHPQAYASALASRGVHSVYLHDSFPDNGDLRTLIAGMPEPPKLIIHPEAPFSPLPAGLTDAEIPSACFHYDVYAYTHRRIRWSMLFDYAFVFHPGFEQVFSVAGHPRSMRLSHALDPKVFSGSEGTRIFELGWVGRTDGPLYSTRRRILPLLAARFKINDWARRHTLEELASVYKRSKIVVNIGRDDYPCDANVRVLEVMAAGALLITSLPSELEKLGFQSGTHFVGHHREHELIDCVRYYLEHDAERECIAGAGRELVLKEHTYDRRAEEIIQILDQDAGRLFAPARFWPEDRVRQIYLDYFCAHDLLGRAFEELSRIAALRPTAVWNSVLPIAGAVRRKLRSRTGNFLSPWSTSKP